MQKDTNILKAVIFDMDGVIADSELHWDDIDADMLREHGVEYKGEHKAQVLGKSFALSLGFYKSQFSLEPSIEELAARRESIAAEYFASVIPIYPDAVAVLEFLREKNLKIGMATSSVGELARPFLQRHGLQEYFDVIVTGDEIERGKPDPDIYLRAAQKLEVEPEHCLVIEDALSGIQAGKSAGMRVAAIPDARFVDVTEYPGKADYVLNNLGELLALAQRIYGL